MASLVTTDIFVMAAPVAIIGVIYYLLARFRRRGLPRSVHVAFLVTLAIVAIWDTYMLVMVSTGGGFSRLIYFDWGKYFLPVTVGSFSLVWSLVSLWEFRTQSRDVAVRVISRVQAFMALIVVALVVMALLGYGYREYQLGVASNNNIAPQRLRTVYHSRHASIDSEVMKRLASNTATPGDVLQQLAVHEDHSVRRNVCHNPATPLSLLSVLAKDENLSVRKSVCHNPATSLSLLSVLVKDESWHIRWCVAKHPNTSAAILAQLASDQSFSVRGSVARNEATPPEVLLKLSRDSHHSVRTTLAMNMSTPVTALTRMAKDNHENVRRLVAGRSDLPLDLQLQLVEDKSPIVRQALLSQINVPREVLAKLENHPDENVRRRVQERYDYYRRLEKQVGKSH